MPSKGRIRYDMLGLASVLKQQEFRVPIYQRSYAWGAEEVNDFWGDLRNSLDSQDEDYFLGSLVLTRSEDDKRLVVIDGQQRLATCSVFLAAMRDVWNSQGESARADDIQTRYLSIFDRRAKENVPRLILNEEDDPFFRDFIVNGDAVDPSRESHERLREAHSSLYSKLQNDFAAHGTHGEDRLLAWLDFVDEAASVITVEVPTEAEAFVIFETLNTRGAELTIGDLLKNYLFMRAGNRLDTVKTAWVSTLTALDISAENEVFVNFLRHHWSSKYGAVRERDLYRSIRDHITTASQAVSYAKEMVDAAKFYAALASSSDAYWSGPGFTSTTRDNVETLDRLELEQNRPLLLAVMQHFTKAEMKKTLHATVNWSVRGIVVGGIGGGRTERAYCDAAVSVRGGKIKTTAALLKELTPIVPDDQTFKEAFASTRQTKSRISRYLLLALERAEMGDKEPELVPNKNEDEVNLEHILPRNAKKADWPSFSPEEVPVWAQRVGNQCLLKKSENLAIGNKPWKDKKPVLSSSSLKLTRLAGSSADWTRNEIASRQAKLADLAVKAWPRSPK
jgi:Protein of unknown function DUF262/Protein of unknown function (DUF1524)